MRFLKRFALCSAAVGVVGALMLPASAAADTQTRVATFFSASDVVKYTVTAAAPGTLHVDTMDCCIPGDRWGSQIFRKTLNPGTSKKVCGNGSITAFSGQTSASQYVHGRVDITYCHGVDIFPAGLFVRFQHPAALTVVP
jgi:hypothetical protein